MQIHVYKDSEIVAKQAATIIAAEILVKPDIVLGLPTGSSPIPMYRELVRMHREGLLNLSRATTFNLDEYMGIGAEHPQSYRRFMDEKGILEASFSYTTAVGLFNSIISFALVLTVNKISRRLTDSGLW